VVLSQASSLVVEQRPSGTPLVARSPSFLFLKLISRLFGAAEFFTVPFLTASFFPSYPPSPRERQFFEVGTLKENFGNELSHFCSPFFRLRPDPSVGIWSNPPASGGSLLRLPFTLVGVLAQDGVKTSQIFCSRGLRVYCNAPQG